MNQKQSQTSTEIYKNKVEILELKRNISGIKNLVDGLNSRIEVKEESIVKLEYKSVELYKLKKKEIKEKKLTNHGGQGDNAKCLMFRQ